MVAYMITDAPHDKNVGSAHDPCTYKQFELLPHFQGILLIFNIPLQNKSTLCKSAGHLSPTNVEYLVAKTYQSFDNHQKCLASRFESSLLETFFQKFFRLLPTHLGLTR